MTYAKTLINHLPYTDIHVVYDRYGQFGNGFVVVIDITDNDLSELVADLESGDMDASLAYDKLKTLAYKQDILIQVAENPATALQKAIDEYHALIWQDEQIK